MDIIKKNRWRIIIALLTYILPILSIAQVTTYPVQVYTQLIPPYTPYVPAYYSVGQNKLKVTIINSDMQQPTLQVYLKMRITSSTFSMINPPEVHIASMELQAGVPLILTQNDLEPYFKSQNVRINGGQSQFYRTQMLPDNFYRFHFEVFELNTNRLLSNNRIGFAQAMITAGDPPLLNIPTKGSVVKESNISNIMFTWTPRHMASVAAAYGTEYEITLVEIQDKQANPDNAFQYSRVLYTERTRSTSFIHTAAQPILIPGMRYGWRVRAIAREGVEEANVFKNNGFSEIFWFDYKGNCSTVSTSGVITKRTEANISWTPTEAIDYTLEYRPKGSSRWYTGKTSGNSGKLYSLKPGETYEYRIGSRCYINDLYDYSDIKAFSMPIELQRSPNCGVLPNINLSNQTPTRELQAGLPVLVGDFPVFITKVTGSGRFSGEGYVGIPYLDGAQIGVTFKDIVVNTDNQMISGFFETKYDEKNNNLLIDGDQILTGGKGVGDIRDGSEKVAFIVDYAINPNVKAKPIKEDGSVDDIAEGQDYMFTKGENGRYQFVIVDDKNEQHKIDTETMPVTIEDSTGSTFEVDEKGKVTKISSNTGIVLDEKAKDQFNPKLAIIDFKESGNSKYALDTYNDVYQKVTEYNDQYRIGDTENCASAKFILPGTTDEVIAFIKSEGSNAKAFTPEKVKFVTTKGKEYQSKYNATDRTWTITVTGGAVKDGQELYAVQEQSAGIYLTLGKLNIFTYEPLKRSVTLVPVNGEMNNLNVQSVKEQLDRIYGKIGIEWTVNKLDGEFKYTPVNGSTFNVTGSGLLSTLTNDMKTINEAFKASGQYQEDGLYLFVLPFAPSDKGEVADTGGDMPLSSQFGYLFPGADGKTVAHELAHGAFNLEHPFSRPGRNSFAKGALTNNLMDYTNGTEFAKLQWDQTRAPGMVIGLFQKDKDGMISLKNSEKLGFSPSGQIVSKRPENYEGNFSRDDNFYISSFTSKEGSYKWKDDAYYLNGDKTSAKFIAWDVDSNSKEQPLATGQRVAIWRDSKNPDCYVLYQWIDVPKGYTSADFSSLKPQIDNLDPSKWEADWVKDADKEKCQKLFDEEKANLSSANICDENLYYAGRNGLAVDNKSIGEKVLPKLNELIAKQNYKQVTDFSNQKVIGDPKYIYEGVQYGTSDPIFKESVLEELNKKMAYLELSSGYKLYTMFFERPCSYDVELANKSAQTFFDESNIDKSKGILCLIIKGKEESTVTIGLAFGSDVASNIQTIVRENMGEKLSNDKFSFTDNLIQTYKAIPKKCYFVNYFISKISDEDKKTWDQNLEEMEKLHRTDIFGKEKNDVLMGDIYLEQTTEDSFAGTSAVAVRYFICDPVSRKPIEEVYFLKEEMKEQYVFSEGTVGIWEPGFSISKLSTKSVGFNTALQLGMKYANFDLRTHVFGIAGKTTYPIFRTFFDYYYTQQPPASEEIRNLVTDVTLGIATSIVPVKYVIYPTAAAIAIYTAQDRTDMALSYLAGFGLVKVAPILFEQGFIVTNKVSNYYRLQKTARSLSNEIDFQLANNLIQSEKNAVDLFFKQPIGTDGKYFEYLIQNATSDGNCFLKISSDGKVLLAQVTESGSGANMRYIAHDFKTDRLVDIEKMDYKKLREIADDVIKVQSGFTDDVYNVLVNNGLKSVQKGQSTLLQNAKNETVAIIHDGKLTPVKWTAAFKAPNTATKTQLDNGYILIKDGNNISFDLGFKPGRILSSDEVNTYLQQTGQVDLMGQPNWAGKIVIEQELNSNTVIYIVEDNISRGPGFYFSRDQISTSEELRQTLAVKEAWKKTVDIPTLRTYKVKPGVKLRVRSGIVGQQTEVDGTLLKGGGHQYQVVDNISDGGWIDYLDLIDKFGIILK